MDALEVRCSNRFRFAERGVLLAMLENGSPSWIRTNDQVINSHLLYR